jgi:hypothetical protein
MGTGKILARLHRANTLKMTLVVVVVAEPMRKKTRMDGGRMVTCYMGRAYNTGMNIGNVDHMSNGLE